MGNYEGDRKPSKDDKQRETARNKEKQDAEQKRLKEAQAKSGRR